MASKTGDEVGAPTVSGEISAGAGNTITLFAKVTPDWPNDAEFVLGQGLENGKFSAREFSGVTLEFLNDATYKTLPKLAKFFEITSQDTKSSTASRVSFFTEGGSTEQIQVAFFILEPGLQIQTLQKGPVQWHHL